MKDAIALFFAIFVSGILVIIAKQHEPQPTLPVIQTAARPNHARSNMLFVPCPLAPVNVPLVRERTA